MNLFDNICILCLVGDKNIQSILSIDYDDIIIEEKLKYIFSELMNFQPEIIKNICIDCLKELNHVYKFKQKCSRNLVSLRDYMNEITSEITECDYSVSAVTDTEHELIKRIHKPANTADNNTEIKKETEDINVNVNVVIKEEHNHDDTNVQCSSFHEIPKEMKDDEPAVNVNVAIKVEKEDSYNDSNMPYCSSLSFNDEHSEMTKQNPVKHESEDDDNCIVTREEIYLTNANTEDSIVKEEFALMNVNIKNEKDLPSETSNTETDSNTKLQNETSNNADVTTSLFTTPTPPHRCPACSTIFPTRCALTTHQRTHCGLKPYVCEVCSKAFSDRANFAVHQRMHTGLKPYTCAQCGRAFSYKTSLVVHERTHNGHRPFKCDECGVGFKQKNQLVSHMRTHTGERPFTCDVCPKAFSVKKSLIQHKRTHSKEKPFSCDVCEATFISTDNLRDHKRRHSDVKPFGCDLCSYRCKRRGDLKSHQQRRHTQ